MKHDNFIDIPFSKGNLDRYIARKVILQSLTAVLPLLRGKFLDIGCGKMPYKKFILSDSAVGEYQGIDIESALEYDKDVVPDYYWDGSEMPLEASSYDSAMATEVMEHVPEPDRFLKEVYRILKDDGTFFLTVPFLWNLHEIPHDEWRYTPFALERLLKGAGFKNIRIEATGGWHLSMAQMLGLWVKRAPMHSYQRTILAFFIKPVMRYLIFKDVRPTNFYEGLMITGLYATANK